MPQRHGPDTFFNFPGCSAAVSFNYMYLYLLISLLSEFTWYSSRLSSLDCLRNQTLKPYAMIFDSFAAAVVGEGFGDNRAM